MGKMTFRHRLSLLLAMVIVMAVGLVLLTAKGSPASNPKTHSIKVGMESHLPPFSYIDNNGSIKGFMVDVVRAVALEEGFDVELYALPWYQLQESLMKTETDMIMSTVEQQKGMGTISSNSVIKSTEMIFVRRDNSYIVNLDDLKNINLGIHSENLIPKILNTIDDNTQEKLKIVDSHEHGILILMNNEVDAYIGNKISGQYIIQKWSQEDYIKTVGEEFNARDNVFSLRAADEEVAAVFNTGLNTIRKNGTYDNIYYKWFGESLASYNRRYKKLLMFVGIGAAAILLFIAAVVKWNSSLKKQVAIRTKEINEANRFKEDIMNSVISGIVTFDRNENITSINAKSLSILGVEKESVLNVNLDNTILVHFFDSSKLASVLNNGAYYKNQTHEINCDGDERIIFYHLYPLKDGDGGTIGAILGFEDVTREKRLNEELIRMDKMKSLGLMVAGFAHEIRTPLTSIKTMTDIMDLKINQSNFRRKFLEIVPKEINRLNGLVADLLEYSKPRRACMVSVDPTEIMQGILGLLNKKINEKNIKIHLNLENKIHVIADKQQIRQVFINLLLNSIEAVGGQDGVIKISAIPYKKTFAISVEDNGIGISPENIDKILNPFYTTKSDGIGLGLFITYKLIKENKGTFHIDSKPGLGTKVSVGLMMDAKGNWYEENTDY